MGRTVISVEEWLDWMEAWVMAGERHACREVAGGPRGFVRSRRPACPWHVDEDFAERYMHVNLGFSVADYFTIGADRKEVVDLFIDIDRRMGLQELSHRLGKGLGPAWRRMVLLVRTNKGWHVHLAPPKGLLLDGDSYRFLVHGLAAMMRIRLDAAATDVRRIARAPWSWHVSGRDFVPVVRPDGREALPLEAKEIYMSMDEVEWDLLDAAISIGAELLGPGDSHGGAGDTGDDEYREIATVRARKRGKIIMETQFGTFKYLAELSGYGYLEYILRKGVLMAGYRRTAAWDVYSVAIVRGLIDASADEVTRWISESVARFPGDGPPEDYVKYLDRYVRYRARKVDLPNPPTFETCITMRPRRGEGELRPWTAGWCAEAVAALAAAGAVEAPAQYLEAARRVGANVDAYGLI